MSACPTLLYLLRDLSKPVLEANSEARVTMRRKVRGRSGTGIDEIQGSREIWEEIWDRH